MPKLIRLYITQCFVGFGISAVFTVMLLYLNVGNLGVLVQKDPMGTLAVLIVWFFNGTVFASVQFAIAIMNLKDDGPQQRGPLK